MKSLSLRACVLFFVVTSVIPAVWSQVVINEFMAANSNGLADQEGEYSDWIELRNTGNTTVNLQGWHLTDSANLLTKWTFPNTNLVAGGYMVVFASGKDLKVPGAELHSNFSLDAAGEY